jgi:hypothetical protein
MFVVKCCKITVKNNTGRGDKAHDSRNKELPVD